jgi:hypothetical protein
MPMVRMPVRTSAVSWERFYESFGAAGTVGVVVTEAGHEVKSLTEQGYQHKERRKRAANRVVFCDLHKRRQATKTPSGPTYPKILVVPP